MTNLAVVPQTTTPAPVVVYRPGLEVTSHLKYSVTATGKNIVVASSDNALAILAYDKRWADLFARNEMTQDVHVVGIPPWTRLEAPPSFGPAVWGERDTHRLLMWLHREYDVQFKLPALEQAIGVCADMNPFHPIRDYLQSIRWDGVPRLATAATRYLGATGALPCELFRRWLISGVARALEPGCKADHVLILEGPQAAGKSTALRTLAGDDFFTDHISDLANKDSRQELHGKWIVELGELDALNRADIGRAKAFFTTQRDNFRAPYARKAESYPRSNIFAGSVNKGKYLRDETGNRRYWCVAVGTIDIVALETDRSQLWAEAVSQYQDDQLWWFDRDSPEDVAFLKELEGDQAERFVSDALTEKLDTFLSQCEDERALHIARGGDPSLRKPGTTVGEILDRMCPTTSIERCDKQLQGRIRDSLEVLKYRSTRIRLPGGREAKREYRYINLEAEAVAAAKAVETVAAESKSKTAEKDQSIGQTAISPDWD